MASVAKRKWTHKGVAREAWVVRWIDRSGAHRQKTFARKKDADGHALKIEAEKAATGHIGYVEGRTIADLSREFLIGAERRYEEGKMKRGSLKNLINAHRLAIVPRLGKMKATDVQPGDVVAFYEWLRTERRLGPNTALERITALGKLMDFGEGRAAVRKNPVPDARKEIGGAVTVRVKTFMPEQVQHLLATARTRAKWQHAQTWRLMECFAHLGAFCGLRFGEITALAIPDVDFNTGRITVRHTLNEWDELTEPKTPAARRSVSMPEHVAALLQIWLREFYVPNERQLIFRSYVSRRGQPGGPLNPASFHNSHWRPLLKRAGLWTEGEDHYHFHALRHFAGSWWLHNRVPITDVAKLMGHANPTITLKIYAHALLTDQERCAVVDRSAAALIDTAPPVALAQELRKTENILEYQ